MEGLVQSTLQRSDHDDEGVGLSVGVAIQLSLHFLGSHVDLDFIGLVGACGVSGILCDCVVDSLSGLRPLVVAGSGDRNDLGNDIGAAIEGQSCGGGVCIVCQLTNSLGSVRCCFLQVNRLLALGDLVGLLEGVIAGRCGESVQLVQQSLLLDSIAQSAASGGNREELLGQRPARRKRSAADAGSRNPALASETRLRGCTKESLAVSTK